MTPDQINQLPPVTQDIARHALDLAPRFGFSPWLMLGIAYAESNFGRALKPPNPTGSGDFIPRPCNPVRDELMRRNPLPGAICRTLPDGIPARKIKGPIQAWVPTGHGWGVGLFQIDWESHHQFISRRTWRDPRSCMEYALEGVLDPARKHLATACGLRGDELLDATIAAYNAGAGRVAKFIRESKPLDGATFHPGYVAKIKRKADELAAASGAWRSPTTTEAANG